MGAFLRHGNYAVAKLIEVTFNTTSLSDVGCTYRLIRRDAVDILKGHYRVGGSHFGLEMLLLAVEKRIPFIQIPVNYKSRVGTSSVTGNKWVAFGLGLTMAGFIIRRRFQTLMTP